MTGRSWHSDSQNRFLNLTVVETYQSRKQSHKSLQSRPIASELEAHMASSLHQLRDQYKIFYIPGAIGLASPPLNPATRKARRPLLKSSLDQNLKYNAKVFQEISPRFLSNQNPSESILPDSASTLS
jgi:hypothetical protein